jgi:TIR domain/VHL beta domain
MGAIFISYRREDSEGHAGRLFEVLAEHFGKASVFMDVAGIEPGVDFRKAIDANVATCSVLLAIIGRGWLTAVDGTGQRRLDSPQDFVRLETASALKRDIPVIPVLVHGAVMPRVDQLPEDMRELAFRNSVELTHARWDSDVQVLIKALARYIAKPDAVPAATHPRETAGTPPGKPSPRLKIAAMAVAAVVVAGGGVIAYQRHQPDPAPIHETKPQNITVDPLQKPAAPKPTKAPTPEKPIEAPTAGHPSGLRSVPGTPSTNIRFVNNSGRPMDVNWINFKGKEVNYLKLAPGQAFNQDTGVSHSWVVRDVQTQRLMTTATATAEPLTVRITVPQ